MFFGPAIAGVRSKPVKTACTAPYIFDAVQYVKFDGSTVGTAVLGCSSVVTIMNFLNLYYGPRRIS